MNGRKLPASIASGGRPLRLAIVGAVAGGLIGVAVAADLGVLGRLQLLLRSDHRAVVSQTTPRPTPRSDDIYAVIGETRSQGQMFPSARLASSEFPLVERLIAGGLVIKRIDPQADGAATFGVSVIHRITLSNGWSFTEASPLPGPLDGRCESYGRPIYKYQLSLGGFSFLIPSHAPIWFGVIGPSVVWTPDSGGAGELRRVGGSELICRAAGG